MLGQELFPNSTNVFLRQYFQIKKSKDRQIDNKEIKITKKLIFPILESKSKNQIIRESDIDEFMKACLEISNILYEKYDSKTTTKLDLEIYDLCLLKIDQSRLSDENKEMIHYLLDSLKDYTLNMMHISKRKKELENIHEKFDYEDFKKSLYGCILSFICIMIGILGSPHIEIKTNILTLLINTGFDFASDLNSYTDTLDILTNPDELDLLKQSESDIK